MKIFLTGSSGFIGKNLLEQLSSKFNFFAPKHNELDLLDGEKVRDILEKEKFDVVIHCANFGGNRSQVNLKNVYNTNTKMFLNLAENRHLFGKMIFLGSGAEYGKQESIVNVKEEDFGKVKPSDEYGRAKYFASEYINETLNIINLRLFGVFGKYEDYLTRFISNIICLSLLGKPIVINQNAIFDYLYISDLVKIVEFFMKNIPKEQFYNVGTGARIELLDVAKIVKELANNPFEINVLKPGYNKEYTCDNSRLISELGNFEFTPVKTAVQELIEWYKINWQIIDLSKLISEVKS